MFPPKPFPASYWLKPDQILAGELPSSPDAKIASQKLSTLVNVGISVVLNFLETSEYEHRYFSKGSFPNYTSELMDLARKKDQLIQCHRFPIPDMKVPSTSQMVDILNAIDSAVEKGKKVYFHCYAGLGRTGTVAGCWLVRHGLNGEQALEELMATRTIQGASAYGASPQTQIQRQFVLSWKSGQ